MTEGAPACIFLPGLVMPAQTRYAALFRGPVHYSYGSLTAPRYLETAARLGRSFRDIATVRYEGLHHLHSAHQADPAAVARELRALWARSAAPA